VFVLGIELDPQYGHADSEGKLSQSETSVEYSHWTLLRHSSTVHSALNMSRKSITKCFTVTVLLLGRKFFRIFLAPTWARGVVEAYALMLRQRVFSLTEIWPSAYPWCGLSSNFRRFYEYLDILCLRVLLHLISYFSSCAQFCFTHSPCTTWIHPPSSPTPYFVLIVCTCCMSRVFNWLTSSVYNHTQPGWGVATIRLDEWGGTLNGPQLEAAEHVTLVHNTVGG